MHRPSQVLQRHRELLHEYEREFRKIRSNVEEQRERDELLGSVRADIGEFKTAASARMDSLVRERGSAQNRCYCMTTWFCEGVGDDDDDDGVGPL